jgi:hypothetical protein
VSSVPRLFADLPLWLLLMTSGGLIALVDLKSFRVQRPVVIILFLGLAYFSFGLFAEIVLRDGVVLRTHLVLSWQLAIFGLLVAFINTKHRVGYFYGGLIFAVSLSAVVSIIQAATGSFYGLWELARGTEFGGPYPFYATELDYLKFVGLRPSGLAAFSVPLAYQLALLVPLFIGWLPRIIKPSSRLLVLALLFIMIISVISIGSRAGLGALTVSIAMILVIQRPAFLPKPLRNRGVIVAVVVGVAAVMLLSMGPRILHPDTFGRISQLRAGLLVVETFPLGIGTEGTTYFDFVKENFDKISHLPDSDRALNYLPHNPYVDSLVFYGYPGAIISSVQMLFLLIYLTYRYSKVKSEHTRPVILGLIGSWVSYFAVSFTHNAGLFTGDTFGWIFLALTFILLNTYGSDNVEEEAETKLVER